MTPSRCAQEHRVGRANMSYALLNYVRALLLQPQTSGGEAKECRNLFPSPPLSVFLPTVPHIAPSITAGGNMIV